MLRSLTALFAAILFALAPIGEADAQTTELRIANGRATFTSDAPLETINGTTSGVSGSVSLDLSNPAAASGTVRVPVSALRTGIDLRDEHLRSANWLDAANHPNIELQISSLDGASDFTSGERVSFHIVGQLSIKGTTRNVRIRAQGQYREGALLVRARWRIQLSDYGVSIPATVQAKVNNEIVISVNIRAAG